jgi:predicted TIM-barrel fold metal-dependent hydrolase
MGRGPDDADIDPAHVARVLRGLYYETALAGSRNSLLPTLEVTTADHILLGTDWPAAPESTVIRNIANLTSFDGFTPEQLHGVERDNALRLFSRFA